MIITVDTETIKMYYSTIVVQLDCLLLTPCGHNLLLKHISYYRLDWKKITSLMETPEKDSKRYNI